MYFIILEIVINRTQAHFSGKFNVLNRFLFPTIIKIGIVTIWKMITQILQNIAN